MWGKYNCELCHCDTDDYFCENCKRIQKIIELYGVSTVKESMERIFIRDAVPIENRTEAECKIVTRSKKAKETKDTKDKSVES
jgi:hypothetical protein